MSICVSSQTKTSTIESCEDYCGGVFEVSQKLSIREAIEGLILLVECSHEGEWDNRICFVPLR